MSVNFVHYNREFVITEFDCRQSTRGKMVLMQVKNACKTQYDSTFNIYRSAIITNCLRESLCLVEIFI